MFENVRSAHCEHYESGVLERGDESHGGRMAEGRKYYRRRADQKVPEENRERRGVHAHNAAVVQSTK